jgi:hypothetical protein
MKRVLIWLLGVLVFGAVGLVALGWLFACPDPKWMSNRIDPLQLSDVVRSCVDRERYDRAVFYYALMGLYGRIDISRVIDKSAHQAAAVLMTSTVRNLTAAQKSSFQASLQATLQDSAKQSEMCSGAKRIGPPDYYPDYMIRHGMRGFIDPDWKSNPQVKMVDIEGIWRGLMATYMHCPASR